MFELEECDFTIFPFLSYEAYIFQYTVFIWMVDTLQKISLNLVEYYFAIYINDDPPFLNLILWLFAGVVMLVDVQ